MGLIDSGIYQNAPRSLLREGLMGYDSAMKAKGQAMEQRGLMAQQGRQEKTFQQQQEEYRRSQEFNKTLGLLSQSNDHRTPEGQQAIIQGLGQKGFGAEAMELAQKFPKQAQPAQKAYQSVETDQGMAAFDSQTGTYGAPAQFNGQPLRKPVKPEGPTTYEIGKDKWEREHKERVLKIQAGNTAKDNELAAAKWEIEKAKKEAEMAKKATDVTEVSAQADEAVSLIDQMIGSEDGVTKLHPGFTSAVGSRLSFSTLGGFKSEPIGGTDAADFQALYEQVKGGAFLEAVAKMKGSGALSDTEGKAATSAISRMKIKQSESEFMRAAKEFRAAIKGRKGRVIAKAAAHAPGMTNAPDQNNDPLGIR